MTDRAPAPSLLSITAPRGSSVAMRMRDMPFWTYFYSAAVLILGGAGLQYPLLEGVEEWGGLALIGLYLRQRHPTLPVLGRSMIGLWTFCIGVAALQLVPLPPTLWTALSGRTLAAEISQVVGQANLWRPVTLLPERTVQALLALLPPGAILLATLRSSNETRWRLVTLAVGFGLLDVALGAAQFASGSGDGLTPFTTDHRGNAVGLFVNRNHQAAFLLTAMVFGAGLGARQARQWGWTARLVAFAYAALMALGVIATTSRMGTALLPVALIFVVIILFNGTLNWKAILVGMVLAAGLTVGALQSGTVQKTLGRFTIVEDERSFFWQDSVKAIQQSFPIGTGIGGFRPAHQAVEGLDHVGSDIPNNAHNDYLELVMDAGIAAAAGLIVALAILIAAMCQFTMLRKKSDERLLAAVGFGGITIFLLHSLVDYPLRMTSLACLFALCSAFTCSEPLATSDKSQPNDEALKFAQRLSFFTAAAVLGLVSVTTALSLHAEQNGDLGMARQWAPWTSSATSSMGADEFLAGRKASAAMLSEQALAVSPIDVAALRTLAFTKEASDPRKTRVMMEMAGRLGWRDRLTQYWLMEHSFETGNLRLAAMRTDALLRQGVLKEQLFAMLHQAVHDPAVMGVVADRLSFKPNWAEPYLTQINELTPNQLFDHGRLLALIARRSPELARTGTALTASKLVDEGRLDDAAALWGPFRSAAVVQDGGFDHLSGDANEGPFGWQLNTPVATRVTAEIPEQPFEGAALHVQSEGVATGIVASQVIQIPPGRWLLRYDTLGPASSSTAFEWRVACHGNAPAQPFTYLDSTATSAEWTLQSRQTNTSAAQCRFWDLQLWSISTKASDLWIDRVSIDLQK